LSHHFLIEQRGEWRKAFRIGGIVGQQELERGGISMPPLCPQPHSIHTIETLERRFPFDAEFSLEVFKSSTKAQTARGQAEIEVGHFKSEPREGSA
jgi:hypothetical protein